MKDCLRLADPEVAHRVTLQFDDFIEWAELCHLVAASATEREQLGDALTANDSRDCVARALSGMASLSVLPDEWDVPSLELLCSNLRSIQRAVDLGLPTVIDAVLVTERFHEAVLMVFQILLWRGSQQSGKPIDELLADRNFQKATDRCSETAVALLTFRDACEHTEVRQAITGLPLIYKYESRT